MLRPSVCLSSVPLCIVAKRCVLEQKLLLTAYRKSYMRKRLVNYQNKWPWPLFKRSYQGHVNHRVTFELNILEKEIKAWFQRTTNRKNLGSIKWTSRDPQRLLWGSTVGYPIATAWLLVLFRYQNICLIIRQYGCSLLILFSYVEAEAVAEDTMDLSSMDF